MNSPGTVYSWPLRTEKAGRRDEERRVAALHIDDVSAGKHKLFRFRRMDFLR